jgi:hypothetical protein
MPKKKKFTSYMTYYVVTTDTNNDGKIGVIEIHAAYPLKQGSLEDMLLEQEEFRGLEIDMIISETDVPAFTLRSQPYLDPL